jgi:hypothetical protein
MLMLKHFPFWRRRVPVLLITGALALVSRNVLSRYQDEFKDEYQPPPPGQSFVVPQNISMPTTMPDPGRPSRADDLARVAMQRPTPPTTKPPPSASGLGLLLSVMAEDPTILRGPMIMMPGRYATVYHDGDGRGNAVITKALPVEPEIHVPGSPLARGDYYDAEAEAAYYVKQWLATQSAGYRAEITVLVHQSELRLLDLIADIKSRSRVPPRSDVSAREALATYFASHLEGSRASTRLAELAAFEALAAVPRKSISLDGKEYVADISHATVDVRPATE